ncbi:hypothetical protein TSOC_013915, partial [Tetrabaena socialis]
MAKPSQCAAPPPLLLGLQAQRRHTISCAKPSHPRRTKSPMSLHCSSRSSSPRQRSSTSFTRWHPTSSSSTPSSPLATTTQSRQYSIRSRVLRQPDSLIRAPTRLLNGAGAPPSTTAAAPPRNRPRVCRPSSPPTAAAGAPSYPQIDRRGAVAKRKKLRVARARAQPATTATVAVVASAARLAWPLRRAAGSSACATSSRPVVAAPCARCRALTATTRCPAPAAPAPAARLALMPLRVLQVLVLVINALLEGNLQPHLAKLDTKLATWGPQASAAGPSGSGSGSGPGPSGSGAGPGPSSSRATAAASSSSSSAAPQPDALAAMTSWNSLAGLASAAATPPPAPAGPSGFWRTTVGSGGAAAAGGGGGGGRMHRGTLKVMDRVDRDVRTLTSRMGADMQWEFEDEYGDEYDDSFDDLSGGV